MIKRRTLVAAAVACLATPGLLRAKELSPQEIFFDKDIPVLGNPKGDVTIAEFFDYQCGYCKTYHPIVSKVVKDDGHVRLVMKDWPVFGLKIGFCRAGRSGDCKSWSIPGGAGCPARSQGRINAGFRFPGA